MMLMPQTPKRILVVEDDKAIEEVVSLKLSHAGFSVDQTSDGQQALDKLKQNQYDLILLDLIMPNVNGFDLLSKMHGLDNKTPKMVMSNLDEPEDMTKAKSLGAVAFLSKFEKSLTGIVEYVENYLK